MAALGSVAAPPITAGPLIDPHHLIDVAYLLLFTLGIMEPAFWYRSLNTITCLTGIWVPVAFSEQKTFPHLSFANQFSVFGAKWPLWEIDLSVMITVNKGTLGLPVNFLFFWGTLRKRYASKRAKTELGPYRIMNG